MVSDTEPTAAAVTVLTLTKQSFTVEQCSAVFLKHRLCCHHKDINAPVCLKREFAVRSRTYEELARCDENHTNSRHSHTTANTFHMSITQKDALKCCVLTDLKVKHGFLMTGEVRAAP